MSSDTLQSAIASIRSGDKETGKLLLAEVIRDDPSNSTGKGAGWIASYFVTEGELNKPPNACAL